LSSLEERVKWLERKVDFLMVLTGNKQLWDRLDELFRKIEELSNEQAE